MTKTKNERITTLENEVAELKLIVHELRGKKSIEPSTTSTVEDKPLTPNKLRAVIIEKAKKFVEGNLKLLISYDFVVINNGTKLYSRQLFQDIKLTTAKCSPNDVFNEHIGKAIALGRALGLDVSEFEQAVQPTKAVLGTVVGHRSKEGIFRTVAPNFVLGKTCTLGSDTAKYGKIINDTNAKYEEG
ncbi:hypothetical protein [Lysinibacillus fusiformis]|uniref:hypothetical protein n=1 Tax=Lysinibacillus fusiformis TaxID=28031 RepID=UPI000888778C|nr:hypothetical protein [Lysinibacillus fusiformis]SCX38352.1 hypothetical protein SAMN02787108_00277 [Lysinibacillus fusiformis]SDB05308.1 hypothetical protein SAMN02787070_00265 [Lysinibacillus fusiformis]SFH75054.1 hypothetical protein SAMN02787080_00264 [Lysinibacillus fusiformis]SFT29738.1 hypothetical protein SAMN02787099_04547 [Lysinibacillus fusiformis]